MHALDTLTIDSFSPFAGQKFRVSAGPWQATLELQDASLLTSHRKDTARAPFSLLWRGAPGLQLPQQIYTVTNDAFGSAEIFIVQNADRPQGSEFEAVFT
jgi:hypothetical protein